MWNTPFGVSATGQGIVFPVPFANLSATVLQLGSSESVILGPLDAGSFPLVSILASIATGTLTMTIEVSPDTLVNAIANNGPYFAPGTFGEGVNGIPTTAVSNPVTLTGPTFFMMQQRLGAGVIRVRFDSGLGNFTTGFGAQLICRAF